MTDKRLDDGGTLQNLHVTYLKKQEKELIRLREGSIKCQMELLGIARKLIYANKSMQDWQNNVGFEMQPGAKKRTLSLI